MFFARHRSRLDGVLLYPYSPQELIGVGGVKAPLHSVDRRHFLRSTLEAANIWKLDRLGYVELISILDFS